MWEMPVSWFIWVASLLFFSLFHLPGQLRARRLWILGIYPHFFIFWFFHSYFFQWLFVPSAMDWQMPLIVKKWTTKEESHLWWSGHLSIFLLTISSTSIHYFVKFFSGRLCNPQPTGQMLLDEGASSSLKGMVDVYIYIYMLIGTSWDMEKGKGKGKDFSWVLCILPKVFLPIYVFV